MNRSLNKVTLIGNVGADPEVLTAIARAELREKFLQADMGITGANFLIAETGSTLIVTNEGNGRMVTSVPRVRSFQMPRETGGTG